MERYATKGWHKRGRIRLRAPSGAVETAAWHGLVWLAVANIIGVWLAIVLLIPSAGGCLGEWTYGRWMPVHLNFQLYGWLNMPLVAWLLKLYRADQPPYARWSVAALWMWGLALILGAASWLSGHSTGKLFLRLDRLHAHLLPGRDPLPLGCAYDRLRAHMASFD